MFVYTCMEINVLVEAVNSLFCFICISYYFISYFYTSTLQPDTIFSIFISPPSSLSLAFVNNRLCATGKSFRPCNCRSYSFVYFTPRNEHHFIRSDGVHAETSRLIDQATREPFESLWWMACTKTSPHPLSRMRSAHLRNSSHVYPTDFSATCTNAKFITKVCRHNRGYLDAVIIVVIYLYLSALCLLHCQIFFEACLALVLSVTARPYLDTQ